MAAGTITFTETVHGSVKKIRAAWTSGTGAEGGTASGATTEVYEGKIVGLATIPSGGGTAPTDNYDITLKDGETDDVLLGAGANRDTANTEYVPETSLGAVAGSKLTLAIAAAGDAKEGTVIVWVR